MGTRIFVKKVLDDKTIQNGRSAGQPYTSFVDDRDQWYTVFNTPTTPDLISRIRAKEGDTINAEVETKTSQKGTFSTVVALDYSPEVAAPVAAPTQTPKSGNKSVDYSKLCEKDKWYIDFEAVKQRSIEKQNRLTNAVHAAVAMVTPGKTTNKDLSEDIKYFFGVCESITNPPAVVDTKTGDDIYDTLPDEGAPF